MSMHRLRNISVRYGNAYADQEPDSPITTRSPITPRRSTDETDTDSIATSISEDAVTDNGLEHVLDYRSRVLRRREAQARIHNTLQHAQDRIDNGLKPVQQFAEDVVRGGDHLYNDTAMPMLDEALFKVQVFLLVIWRLLARFFWYTTELLIQVISSIPRLLLRGLWLFGDMIDASFEFMLDLLGGAFRFTIDLLHQVFLPLLGLIRNIPWNTVQSIAVAIGILTVVMGMLHGFMGMSTYICNDPTLVGACKTLPEVCKHSNLNSVLTHERAVLTKLANNSDIIMHRINDAERTPVPDIAPIRGLVTETTSLVEFTRVHNANLSTFSKGQDIYAIAKAVHSNVTALHQAAQMYTSFHETRKRELERKAIRVLDSARSSRPHSPTERFFTESLAYFIPRSFSLTGVVRTTALYSDMVTYFISHAETTLILQHGVEIEHSVYNLRHDLLPVRKVIKEYEPFWRLACENHDRASQPGHDRCHIDPSELLKELQNAMDNAGTPFRSLEELHKLYKEINKRMITLRRGLEKLLKDARRLKNRPVDAASARAILHQFVAEVGRWEVYMGSGTFRVTLGLGPGNVQGSRWQLAEDGETYTAIYADPYFPGIPNQ